MNTNPDEELLALWVEDELDAASQPAVEAWVAAQPEWLERREQARRMKALLRASLPAAEEPPYAEFFNARIGREIAREQQAAAALAPVAAPRRPAWRWFLPVTAVAGMVLCFWAGTRLASGPTVVQSPPPANSAPAPVLYTPEKGVKAAYFTSEPADAMVIVLDGVAAIPDSFELPETAAKEEPPAATATADLDPPVR